MEENSELVKTLGLFLHDPLLLDSNLRENPDIEDICKSQDTAEVHNRASNLICARFSQNDRRKDRQLMNILRSLGNFLNGVSGLARATQQHEVDLAARKMVLDVAFRFLIKNLKSIHSRL